MHVLGRCRRFAGVLSSVLPCLAGQSMPRPMAVEMVLAAGRAWATSSTCAGPAFHTD
jgi:hypothetical protein